VSEDIFEKIVWYHFWFFNFQNSAEVRPMPMKTMTPNNNIWSGIPLFVAMESVGDGEGAV
jgi:hypothetical protein